VVNLNLPEKTIKLSFKSDYETRIWLEGLRAAVETEKEIRRTVEGVLKFNVSTLYFYFSAQMDHLLQNFINSLTSGLMLSMSAVQFSAELKKIATEFGYLCDAFYARKPFVLALFRFLVTSIHKKIREFVTDYWNKFSINMHAGEIVLIASALCAYDAKLNFWKVLDDGFTWADAVLPTLSWKLFQNSTNPLTNILMEMPNSTYTENCKIYSNSCSQLESHLYFIWGNYTEVPMLAFAEELLKLACKLVAAFLIVIIFILQTESHQSHIYIAILNSTYLKMIKAFEKKAHQATNCQLSLARIKELLDEQYLLSLLIKIETIAFKKLKKEWRDEITKRLLPTEPFLDFEFSKNLTNLAQKFTAYLNLIYQENHTSNLMFEIYDAFLSVYYKLYINSADKMNLENYKKYSLKICQDLKVLQVHFETNKYPQAAKNIFKLQQLKIFDETDKMDECIMAISNMQVFHPELNNEKEVERLMHAKFLYPKVLLNHIQNYMTTAIEGMKKDKKAKLFDEKMPVIYYVCTFKALLKARLATRQAEGPGVSRNFTLSGKKDTKIKLDCRPTSYAHLYDTEGWASLLKFDVRIDELDIHNHLKIE
jgi:hypothetical protein